MIESAWTSVDANTWNQFN